MPLPESFGVKVHSSAQSVRQGSKLSSLVPSSDSSCVRWQNSSAGPMHAGNEPSPWP